MRKGFIATAVVLFFVSAFWLSVPTGCANMIPPSGGPRDTIPPILVKATPVDSSLNFKGNRITLTFNEEVDVKDLNTIIYSPTLESTPGVSAKGRTITVRFRDTLQPRTTYIINFGKAIVDFTEGNAVKNFGYVFSTGSYLDSLEISGRVLLAENAGVDTTMIVVLHRDLRDSSVYNKTPPYVTRLNKDGSFRFHNLPKDTFAVYAIGGAEMSKRYQSISTQLFAFKNTPVVPNADSVLLYAYKEPNPNANQSSVSLPSKIPQNDRRLRLNSPAAGGQDLLNDYVLGFPVPLKNFDSAKVHLATDSVYSPAPFAAALDSTKKEMRIKTSWKENTAYHVILEKDFASDTAGRQLLKTDTLSFLTKKKTDYGSLALRIKNLSSFKNPVLQFVQNNQVVFSVPIKSGMYNQALFIPGEYSLRVFDDLNGNGKWDPGHFFGKKKQPEIVYPIQRTITIKPSWDNEFDIVL